MEHQIQNQRDHGLLAKDILRFLNLAIKMMHLNWMGVFCPGTTRLDLFSALFGDSILFTLLPPLRAQSACALKLSKRLSISQKCEM